MSTALSQRFEHSVQTQERLRAAPRYNRWICDLISPYITGRVLDIGSALGNITEHFLDRDEVVSIDIEEQYVKYLSSRFAASGQFQARVLDAANPQAAQILGPGSFDSAMCLNVIEHIPDHGAVLRNTAALLKPGGTFAVVAPAVPAIFGTMDLADHHCRRYTRSTLTDLFKDAGFEILTARYFNFIGAIGWFYYGRILRREYIPEGGALGLIDRLLQLGRFVESLIPPPFGQSLVCVGRLPGS